MKLSEWIEKYGDCEVTEEMEKCIEKTKKKGKWMPVAGERYWYVTSYGSVYSDTWSRHYADEYRIDFLRIFKTEEEAKRYLEIQKACKEASFEPDLEDCNQCKCVFCYDCKFKRLDILYIKVSHYGQPFMFKDVETAEKLINKFGEKDIAKYVLGVEVE